MQNISRYDVKICEQLLFKESNAKCAENVLTCCYQLIALANDV